MLIDAHCHLDDEQFGNDLDAVIAHAEQAGVHAIITAGTDVASSRTAVALAERYKNVYAVVGIHPQYAEAFDDKNFAAIRELALQRKVIGIGEIGLDFHYPDGAPRDLQEKVFSAQLDLAAEIGKSVVVHDRDAHDAVMDILRRGAGKPCGILHCFSGDLVMAREAIDLGYLISFTGSVTFKNASRVHTLAAALPLESIVIETDAPYLSPVRGKRNEPANVARVAARIAELKKIQLSVVEQTTTENCRAVFGLFIGE